MHIFSNNISNISINPQTIYITGKFKNKIFYYHIQTLLHDKFQVVT